MSAQALKITLHMVTSLDGYIAKKNNDMSWFETTDVYENGVEVSNQAAADFLKKIDCYVMGYNTYKLASDLSEAHGWAYGDTPVFVVTNRDLFDERRTVSFYAGDLQNMVAQVLKPKYQNVWLVGGAKLAGDFLRLNLVDEIRQSILPIILGDGLPLFKSGGQEQALHLINVTTYKSGMVELHYEVRR